MKIKYKIIGVFILSIFVSVIIFSLTTYSLLNKGCLGGITPKEVRQVTEEIARSINEKQKLQLQQAKKILDKAARQHKHMEFDILLASGSQVSSQQKAQVISQEELIKGLSQNGQYDSDKWMVAKPVSLNGEQGYLITVVNKKYFKTITYYFNGPRAHGVLGKIMILGLIITLIISSAVTYLFSRNIMLRMKKIDQAIDEFELGNLQIRIEDQKPDEIGKLAYSFNDMAKKIQDQVKRQEEYEEKRKQLISNISHDLRTPLASIVGYSELLMDETEKGSSQNKYLGIIYRKALYMEKLLNQLLEFSRLESGNMKLEQKREDIVETVREILIEYIPVLDEQQIELELELEQQPVVLYFDKNKMERVIRNLIDNALKYGMARKKLRIAVYKEENQVIIEVQDFGAGMNEETLEHIFERFYRGNKGRGTRLGGMGLGLSIAQEIVKQHDGNLKITSTINEGTKACIKLPVRI